MTQNETLAENLIVAEVAGPVEPARPSPWGFWATMAFSLAVIGLFFVLSTVVTLGFIVVQCTASQNFGEDDFMRLATNGRLFSLAK